MQVFAVVFCVLFAATAAATFSKANLSDDHYQGKAVRNTAFADIQTENNCETFSTGWVRYNRESQESGIFHTTWIINGLPTETEYDLGIELVQPGSETPSLPGGGSSFVMDTVMSDATGKIRHVIGETDLALGEYSGVRFFLNSSACQLWTQDRTASYSSFKINKEISP